MLFRFGDWYRCHVGKSYNLVKNGTIRLYLGDSFPQVAHSFPELRDSFPEVRDFFRKIGDCFREVGDSFREVGDCFPKIENEISNMIFNHCFSSHLSRIFIEIVYNKSF